MIKDPETAPLKGPAEDARLRLLVISPGGMGVRPLPELGTFSLGRGKQADIALEDPAISRRHALLHVDGDLLQLEDLGSQNGCRVAGRKLGKGEQVELVPGEAIELGDTLVVVQREPGRLPRRAQSHRSLGMVDIQRMIERLAGSTISVLLRGEPGVGKQVMARRIHDLSPRRGQPFVELHCAAASEQALESELFGQERSGADGQERFHLGRLEAADRGTLVLDEVSLLPVPLQGKLLRALEQREVLRVGAATPRPVDVRIIASTNADLEQLVQRGAFRSDLYFRLNGFEVRVPPLRERIDEISSLARTFIEARCRQDARPPLPLSPDALRELERYSWPGNVRELRNVIERAVIVCFDGAILPEHLPPLETEPAAPTPGATLKEDLERAERRRIQEALDACDGNRTRAAERLGISRRTLSYRLAEYGITQKKKGRR